ncbi:hypothetical protein D3C72_987400 [compost metagenome]
MQIVKPVLLTQFSETLDQLLLQGVELVAAFRQVARSNLVFEPDPLEEGRFVQRGRRISVVFQHLRIAHAVPRQIEARVEGRLVSLPGVAHKTPGVFRNAEFGHQLIAGNHLFHDLQAHLVQLGGHLFQLFYLGEGELVVGILTPVRFAVHGVEVKPVFGGFFAPVRALDNTDSFHYQPPIEREVEPVALRCMVDCLATDSPKPPRVTVLVVAGFGAIADFGTVAVRPGVAAP